MSSGSAGLFRGRASDPLTMNNGHRRSVPLLPLALAAAMLPGCGGQGEPSPAPGGETAAIAESALHYAREAPPLRVSLPESEDMTAGAPLALTSSLHSPVRVETVFFRTGDTLSAGDTLLLGRDLLAEADLVRLESRIYRLEAEMGSSPAADDALYLEADSLRRVADSLARGVMLPLVSPFDGLIDALAVSTGEMLLPGSHAAVVLPPGPSRERMRLVTLWEGYEPNSWPRDLGPLRLLEARGESALYSGESDTGLVGFPGLYLIDRAALWDDQLREYVMLESGDTVLVERFATGSDSRSSGLVAVLAPGMPLSSPLAGWDR
ncbi:hypothetical protein JW921_11670 [Candidatus Fermentibacterales bacterium]|nr:hypothetical protein [Candidatus Fermentibacterales bacterium]